MTRTVGRSGIGAPGPAPGTLHGRGARHNVAMGSKQLLNNAGPTLVQLPQFYGALRYTQGCGNRGSRGAPGSFARMARNVLIRGDSRWRSLSIIRLSRARRATASSLPIQVAWSTDSKPYAPMRPLLVRQGSTAINRRRSAKRSFEHLQ